MPSATTALLPIDEMAGLSGATVAWLKQEAVAGRIPSLRVEHRILFNAEAVMRVLLKRAAEFKEPALDAKTKEAGDG